MTAATGVAPRTVVGRVIEHRFLTYRRTFRASLFGSFLMPVMFLTAMGIGLGSYVDQGPTGQVAGVSYLVFLAPGLLASTAMQSGAFEATFPIIGGLEWNRTFHAMYATPISGRDIALGNLIWVGLRLTLITTIFTIAIVLFGAAISAMIVLAIPCAILTGLAFAAPIAAFSATQRTPEKFNAIFRFGITPLFLFSGTFFPVEQLPTALQAVAWVTPLYHGVRLCRGFAMGTIGAEPWFAVVDVLYLTVCVVVGTYFAVRTVSARLVRG